MSIRTWGIVGTGRLGRGIAELVATKGFDVILYGRTGAELESTRQYLDMALQRAVDHWALTESEARVIMARFHFTTEIAQMAQADIAIEALISDLEDHRQMLRTLDQVCRKDVILMSNTSTLSITELAAATYRPGRVIGCHFLTPMTKTKVVEIVRGLKTTDETVTEVKELMTLVDRVGIEVYESTGYVTTRLIIPMINEACNLLMERIASAEDIDTAMRLGYEMARGPLETADRIGLDTVLTACERLWAEYGDLKFRPAPILRQLVRAGLLGVETGQGFFHYNEAGDRIKPGGAAK